MSVINLTAMADQENQPTDETKQTVDSGNISQDENKEEKEAANSPILENKDEAITEKEVEGTDGYKNTDAKIVLSGPLSKIYTKALNLVYANEDTGTELLTTDEELTEDDDQNTNLYVYCCDDSLDSGDLVEATEKLSQAMNSKKYKSVILSLESNGNMNNRIGLLDSFASEVGVKVCFSRNRALEAINGSLRG
jgi:hypothetical protein